MQIELLSNQNCYLIKIELSQTSNLKLVKYLKIRFLSITFVMYKQSLLLVFYAFKNISQRNHRYKLIMRVRQLSIRSFMSRKCISYKKYNNNREKRSMYVLLKKKYFYIKIKQIMDVDIFLGQCEIK